METIALARNAMATRFEILLHGENAAALRAAGEEALDEIGRLEIMPVTQSFAGFQVDRK